MKNLFNALILIFTLSLFTNCTSEEEERGLEVLSSEYLVEVHSSWRDLNGNSGNSVYMDTIFFDLIDNGVNVELGSVNHDLTFFEKSGNVCKYLFNLNGTTTQLDLDEENEIVKVEFRSSWPSGSTTKKVEFDY